MRSAHSLSMSCRRKRGFIAFIVAVAALAAPAVAQAADDYPANLRAPATGTVQDPWGFWNRQCVSFVAWRMNRDGGAGSFTNNMSGGHWGNAYQWAGNATLLGYPVNSIPTIGAVAQWNAYEGGAGSAGHVAYVSGVAADGSVTVEEYNFGTNGAYGTRSGVRAPRYIHINNSPRGAFDLAQSPTPGMVRVAGWGFDPDALTMPIAMHVYVGGEAGQPGAEGHVFTASSGRADVGAAYPGIGNNHGLDVTFWTAKRGSQSVCLYAINIGAGGNVWVTNSCKTITISADPVGAFDLAQSPSAGMVRVAGWGFDPDALTTPIAMHVYVGGEAGQPGVEGHAFTASSVRADVGAAYPGIGNNHGLNVTFQTAQRGSQPVCLYAINIGPGGNVWVTNSCKTITIGR